METFAIEPISLGVDPFVHFVTSLIVDQKTSNGLQLPLLLQLFDGPIGLPNLLLLLLFLDSYVHLKRTLFQWLLLPGPPTAFLDDGDSLFRHDSVLQWDMVLVLEFSCALLWMEQGVCDLQCGGSWC